MLQGFFGTYTPRMDDKGRVTLPARYRDNFATGAMLVRGQDHCLYVFTPEGFEEFAESAINAPITDEQKPDAQGRISIPARMREYAGLSKDLVITGVGLRMEIWDATEWQEYEARQEAAYAEPERGLLGN